MIFFDKGKIVGEFSGADHTDFQNHRLNYSSQKVF